MSRNEGYHGAVYLYGADCDDGDMGGDGARCGDGRIFQETKPCISQPDARVFGRRNDRGKFLVPASTGDRDGKADAEDAGVYCGDDRFFERGGFHVAFG